MIPCAVHWRKQLTQSSDLCLACGLCCDGTLFSDVTLPKEGISSALASAGIRLVEDGKAFEQPCPAHVACTCSVYAGRPPSCRTFRCKTLRALERGKTSFERALGFIAQAARQRDAIRRDLAGLGPNWAGISLDGAVLPLEAALKGVDGMEDKREIGTIILKLLVLRKFLGEHFLSWPK